MKEDFKFVLYQSEEGDVAVNAAIKDESIWLTQKAMAELSGCSTDNISLHLKNIFSERELREEATVEEISVVQTEGNRQVRRKIRFYNLDAIIFVGYRGNKSTAIPLA